MASFRSLDIICRRATEVRLIRRRMLPALRQHSVRTKINFNFRTFRMKGKSKVDEKEEKSIALRAQKLVSFQEKTKSNFMDAIDSFSVDNPNRRGHVEFIYACLRHIEEFGLERDLETYKKLMDVFPKGKMITTSVMLSELQYFPRQQQCATDVLQKMEDFGVMPDLEMHDIIVNSFGKRSYVYRRYCRMMYWFPKFKNASPFLLPNPVPNDTLELAKLAINRINTVDLQSVTTVHQAIEVLDAVDYTWIVSAQSPTQKELIEKLPDDKPIFVDGAFRLWLRNSSIAYFILRADTKDYPDIDEDEDDVANLTSRITAETEEQAVIVRPSVHEQEDGTILATCATGTSSRDSLLSWVRLLQEKNPRLLDVPILFTLSAPSTAVVPVNASGLVDDVPNLEVKHEPNPT